MITGLVVLIAAALLVFRLWHLQIYLGPMYAEKARENRVRTLDITAPRGNIYDRRGREIVGNRPCFNVVWSRENSAMDATLSKRLARLLNMEESELIERIRQAASKSLPHVPIRLKEDVDWTTVALVENNRLSLPGVRIEVVPRRRYHYGDLASHLLGYLAEINEEELEQARKEAGEEGRPVYQGGDLVGRQGLEKIMEKELRGAEGPGLHGG